MPAKTGYNPKTWTAYGEKDLNVCKSKCTADPDCGSFVMCESGPAGCWGKRRRPTLTDRANKRYDDPEGGDRGCFTYIKDVGAVTGDTIGPSCCYRKGTDEACGDPVKIAACAPGANCCGPSGCK